jgi:hypothetical protein
MHKAARRSQKETAVKWWTLYLTIVNLLLLLWTAIAVYRIHELLDSLAGAR